MSIKWSSISSLWFYRRRSLESIALVVGVVSQNLGVLRISSGFLSTSMVVWRSVSMLVAFLRNRSKRSTIFHLFCNGSTRRFGDCNVSIRIRYTTSGKLYKLRRFTARTKSAERDSLYTDDCDVIGNSIQHIQQLMDQLLHFCKAYLFPGQNSDDEITPD